MSTITWHEIGQVHLAHDRRGLFDLVFVATGHAAGGGRDRPGRRAGRAAAHAPLDDPDGVAVLLDSLREAGAHEQAAALLARDPAALDDPDVVAVLLDRLRRAGAADQAAALAAQLPAASMFGLYLEQEASADQFRFGREADGTPAAPWAGKTWTYGLFPGRGDREATLPVGLLPIAEFAR